jgi:hypothetical protein
MQGGLACLTHAIDTKAGLYVAGKRHRHNTSLSAAGICCHLQMIQDAMSGIRHSAYCGKPSLVLQNQLVSSQTTSDIVIFATPTHWAPQSTQGGAYEYMLHRCMVCIAKLPAMLAGCNRCHCLPLWCVQVQPSTPITRQGAGLCRNHHQGGSPTRCYVGVSSASWLSQRPCGWW